MLLIYLTLLAQSLEIDQNGGPVDILIDNKRVFTVESEYLGSLSSSLDEVLKNIREGDNHIRIAQDGSEISYTVNIPNTGNSGGGENVNQSILDILNETLRDYVKRDEINMSDYYIKSDVDGKIEEVRNKIPDLTSLRNIKSLIVDSSNEEDFPLTIQGSMLPVSEINLLRASSRAGDFILKTRDTMNLVFSFRNFPYMSFSPNVEINGIPSNIMVAPKIYKDSFGVDPYVSQRELTRRSQTITHLSPTDSYYPAAEFVPGKPLFMTGKTFAMDDGMWRESTRSDHIDCIPSVKPSGTWREYLGVCTEVLSDTNEVKFASHGDFLVTVDDSSTFKVGDIIHLTDSGGIGVIGDDTALTVRVSRSIIGVVTGVVDGRTVAVFKD